MKVLMKEYTNHHIVDAFDLKKRTQSQNSTDLVNTYFTYYPQDSWNMARDSIVLIQEIEPETRLLEYKGGSAYDGYQIHMSNMNFPYQYIFWKISCIEAHNWIIRVDSPEIMFATSSWEDTSPEHDKTYFPWLSNILSKKLGCRFCFNFPYGQFESIRYKNKPSAATLLDPKLLTKLSSTYDAILGSCFNGDAGAPKIQSCRDNHVVVSSFRKITSRKFEEILDPNSRWIKEEAIECSSKSQIKKVYKKISAK